MTRKMTVRLGAGLLAATHALGPSVSHADPFQAWYQHTFFQRLNERWSVGNYLDLRVTDAVGELATSMVSPRVRFDASPHWQIQLNTTWVEAQAADSGRRTEFLRLETEFNPRYALGDALTFSARNRFELRKIEREDGINARLRVRPQLDWRTPWAGPVDGLFINHEMFYDFDRDQVTEHRLVPFGLVFHAGRNTELRAYHLWRRTLAAGRWYGFHAVGLQANMNF